MSENKECSLRSKSFKKDIALLEDHYKKDILFICKNAQNLGMEFVKKFQATDEITDSIRTCLENYKDKTYIEILDNNLIKPEFIREDEDFQKLFQYFIIMDSRLVPKVKKSSQV